MYSIDFTDIALEDLAKLKKSEPKAFEKAKDLVDDILLHPKTGIGKPHPLKGNRSGQWSRSITQKHRLIYEIREDKILVLVLSAYGHYNDK